MSLDALQASAAEGRPPKKLDKNEREMLGRKALGKLSDGGVGSLSSEELEHAKAQVERNRDSRGLAILNLLDNPKRGTNLTGQLAAVVEDARKLGIKKAEVIKELLERAPMKAQPD